MPSAPFVFDFSVMLSEGRGKWFAQRFSAFTLIILPMLTILFLFVRIIDYQNFGFVLWNGILIPLPLITTRYYDLPYSFWKDKVTWIFVLLQTVLVVFAGFNYYQINQGDCTAYADEGIFKPIAGIFTPGIISVPQLQLANQTYNSRSFRCADFQQAHLNEADLHGAKLQGADLLGAQLQGANLDSAQLQGANLSYAQLQGANLSYAQSQGANLSKAQLQGASCSSQDTSNDDGKARIKERTNKRSSLDGCNFGELKPGHIEEIMEIISELPDGVPGKIKSKIEGRLDSRRNKEASIYNARCGTLSEKMADVIIEYWDTEVPLKYLNEWYGEGKRCPS